MTPGLDMPGVAVAGCGYWGKNLVHNFAQLGALRTVCDGAEMDSPSGQTWTLRPGASALRIRCERLGLYWTWMLKSRSTW